jgi:beta-lactam-binding protein with PASTA domain
MIDRNLILATILPFTAACMGYCLVSWYFTSSLLTAPTVIGLSLSGGCALLSQNRLNARVMAYINDDTYQPGTIIDQKPRPGKPIKQHQAILLTVIAEKQLVSMPDIRGMLIPDATKMLDKLGLKYFLYVQTGNVPSNTCIAQSIAPQTKVESGTSLVLYYAVAKKNHYLLPNFIAMPVIEALSLIDTQGHYVECIHYRTHEIVSKEIAQNGIVVAQKPLAGTLIEEQQKETMYLTIKI